MTPWIDWTPAPCPVPRLRTVDVRLRGFGKQAITGHAAQFDWDWTGPERGNVMKYRKTPPAKVFGGGA